MLEHNTVDFVFSFALPVFFLLFNASFLKKSGIIYIANVMWLEDHVYSVHVAPVETLFTNVSQGLEKWLGE